MKPNGDVLFRFDIHLRNDVQASNIEEVKRRLGGTKGYDRDFLFTTSDLEYLSRFTRILNFEIDEQTSIRSKLFRDIEFLTENDFTNFSIQMIIERDHTCHFGI